MAVRTIEVREKVMARNDEIARAVRARFEAAGVTAFNFVSSPGAGKTLLLERTLAELNAELDIAVIAGDVQTQNDADRLARHTRRVVQAVVTNGACHMDARQIEFALELVDLDVIDLVFIENVGNLVCPASWDLGETARIVLFSVTEGEDKPLKYPRMFQTSQYVIMTKVDLLPHVPFDMHRAVANAKLINPGLAFFFVSAHTGQGMESWFDFIRQRAPLRVR